MPNIQGQKKWSEVRLLETHELARGGINGNLNEQAKALADRTEFLNQEKANKSEIVQGVFEFGTYAEFNAAKTTLPANCTIVIGEENTTGSGAWSGGNNRWNGSVLTKSSYDPVKELNKYINEKIELIEQDDAELLVDAAGNILRKQKSNGDLFLAGLDKSVQENVSELKNDLRDANEKISYDTNDSAFRLIDESGNVILSVLATGEIITQDGSIQGLIRELKGSVDKSSNYELSAFVDLSKDLQPSNFAINQSALLSKSIAVNSNYTPLNTPYRNDDGVVHPCVIQLDKPMLGFKYWMCVTPYGNMQILEENPCIYGSNDLDNWNLIKGIEQPLDNPPDWDERGTGEKGFLSDCFWVYDNKTCELYCCYRKCYTHGLSKYNDTDIYQLLYRKTRNGLNWSEPVQFFPDTLAGFDELASPSIVWDGVSQKWVMYAFDDGNRLYMRTNDDFRNKDGWSARIEIGFQAFASVNNLGGWHLETRWIGDRLFMLINDYRLNGTLYFAYADKTDLSRWTFSNTKLVTGNPSGCYKASFITEEDATSVKIHVFWTDSSNNRKLRKFTITEGKI